MVTGWPRPRSGRGLFTAVDVVSSSPAAIEATCGAGGSLISVGTCVAYLDIPQQPLGVTCITG